MSSDDDDLNEDLRQVVGKRSRVGAADSDEDFDDEDFGGRKPARKRRAAAPSEEDEEDEVDDLDAFADDGFGPDLMGDEADRARLEAMTELAREMELADRAEAREDALERRKNQRLLQQQQHGSKPSRKTTRTSAASARASTRAKKPENRAKRDAMEELKAARVRKAQPRREQEWEAESPDVSGDEAEAGRHRQQPSQSASEDELLERQPLEGSDDEGEEDGERRHHEDDESEEAGFEDVGGALVRRHKLEAWIGKPFLERTLPGCMLRLSFGQKDGQPFYILAQVVEVQAQPNGKVRDALGRSHENPYRLGEGANKTRTNKWVIVRRGASDRLMPFMLVSNSPPTEEEWNSWYKEQARANSPQLTLADIKAARERLLAADAYKFTAEDVQRMVEERRAAGGSRRNTAAERARLWRDVQHASESGDLATAEQLRQQVESMEQAAKLEGERSKGTNMAAVNRKNMEGNFQNAFRDVTSRPEGSRMDAAGNDPFSRRKTESRNYWATRRKGPEEAEAAAPAGPGLPPVSTATAAEADAEEPDTPAARAHQDLDTGLVELDIDLSVLALPQAPPLVAKLLSSDWRASLSRFAVPPDISQRRTLTLTEYKQRQGMA